MWILPHSRGPIRPLMRAAPRLVNSHPFQDPTNGGAIQAFARDPDCVKFLNDDVVEAKLKNAKKLSEVDVEGYSTMFHVGGHGPIIDLPLPSPVNTTLVSQFYQAGKITSGACHVPAAMIECQDIHGMGDAIPFSLQDEITERAEPWTPKVVDGHLITGQNPASAASMAPATLRALGA